MAKASKAGVGEILSAAEKDELKRFVRRGERDLKKDATLNASGNLRTLSQPASKLMAPKTEQTCPGD